LAFVDPSRSSICGAAIDLFRPIHGASPDRRRFSTGAGLGLILRKRIWAKTSRKGGFVELLAAKYMRLTVLGYEHRLKHCG
jgi:hypothetical protein